ncbi:PLP-dependent aminotransferase family protein [Phyllobacterium sp. YR531]|uniref:aminotransferase-like domain-containing protein n=1 Tax=Phyllobacterium sp. YR531 TaxID=1144343 RepID=UPI00026FAA7D|nr:PLP-dependent aminotransferase family protein [Phyllobacterium sp. YR531]EJM98117.1 transcriptional regulator with HTH domain and aminotransferase domain containing protein [Phyllobacterium sp. YR531]
MSDRNDRYSTRISNMRASEVRELLKLLDQPGIISFAGGIPDPALFPTDAIQQAYNDILSENAGAALQYSVSEGYRPLREWLAQHMASLGVDCTIDNIIITTGSQQALDYIGKLFISPGDTILTTWPTYLGALQAFNAYEPNYDRLTPDGGNTTPDEYKKHAEQAGGQVKLAYLTADFSNPTGETIGLAERSKLIELAHDLDIPLIEDAAYRSLRFDGENAPSMLALDIKRQGDIDKTRVIYSGSFSKTLTPGLRVGWVCAAKPIISKLVLIKQAADLHSPTINQMVIHHVAERHFDQQVEKARASYRQRRDYMLQALQRYMPDGVTWTKPEGGMFVWMTLPEHMNGAELLAKSIKEIQVAFVPGGAFHADGTGKNTIRLNYSLPDAEAIDTGMSRLGKLIKLEMTAA